MFYWISIFIRGLKQYYHHSLARDLQETQTHRSQFIQKRISSLETEIQRFDEIIEDNPFHLDALEAFSHDEYGYKDKEVRDRVFQKQREVHQIVLNNVQHYQVSVPQDLLATYFEHWKSFEKRYEHFTVSDAVDFESER